MVPYLMQVLLYRLVQLLIFSYFFDTGFKIYAIVIDKQRTMLQGLEIAGALLVQISIFILMVKKAYIKKYINWLTDLKPRLNPFFGLMVVSIPLVLYGIYFYSYPGEYYGFNPRSFVLTVLFFFIGAYTEEFIFRGFFFRLLVNRKKKYTLYFVAFQALLFTFIHFYNPGNSFIRIGIIFLAGFLLGLISLKGFTYAVVFHFLWNFLQAYMLGLNVSGFTFSNSFNVLQNASAWENNIFSAIPLFVAIVILVTFYFRDRRNFI